MGGIRLRNMAEESVLANYFQNGMDIWLPPEDEELIVPATSLTDATADAAFTLSSWMTAHHNRLWTPQRLRCVLLNRGQATAGGPGLTQANPVFSATDEFSFVIVGKLYNRPITETVRMLTANVSSPGGNQRSHIDTINHFDEITSISHANKVGDWGDTTALQVCVGTANCALGEGAQTRYNLRTPFKMANTSLFNGIMYTDGAGVASGTGGSAVSWENDSQRLRIPGKVPEFNDSQGGWTVDVTADTFTKTAHGLVDGMLVQVKSLGDGLPTNIAEATSYYIVNAAANTIQLSTTPGASSGSVTPINMAAGGLFADGEQVEIMRPERKYRRARLSYNEGLYIEGV